MISIELSQRSLSSLSFWWYWNQPEAKLCSFIPHLLLLHSRSSSSSQSLKILLLFILSYKYRADFMIIYLIWSKTVSNCARGYIVRLTTVTRTAQCPTHSSIRSFLLANIINIRTNECNHCYWMHCNWTINKIKLNRVYKYSNATM